jgi:putative membrane protein
MKQTSLAQRSFGLLLCATFATAACAQNDGGRQAGTLSRPSASEPAGMSGADKGMLEDIAQANLAEIATGQLALQKGQSAQVKSFAQMMVDDHTKALGEVRQLASAKGVRLPDEPDLKHKAKSKVLEMSEGDNFDRRYISHAGVGDHKSTLDLLQKTQSRAKDPELRALATKMQGVVRGHLQQAQALDKSSR